jgi:hypothetical protein
MNTVNYFFCVIALLALQACGGEKRNNVNKVIEPEPQVVHELQPEKIPAYIADFKEAYAQLEFQFEGQKSAINFADFDQENNILYAFYEQGILAIGFDFEENTPLASLTVYETDEEGKVKQEFSSHEIEVTEQGGNFLYTGSVIKESSQGLFSIRLVMNEAILSSGNSTVEVSGTKALVNGTLGTLTYIQIEELIKNSTEVDTLELQEISGSINDEINMHTGRLIRGAKLTTFVPKSGNVNSGGVDLFAAGFKRIYEAGGIVGVHAWCCENGQSAHLLAKDDPAHGAQLTYFREMLGKALGPEFYFFTINSAPAKDIHHMTEAELAKYLLSK